MTLRRWETSPMRLFIALAFAVALTAACMEVWFARSEMFGRAVPPTLTY